MFALILWSDLCLDLQCISIAFPNLVNITLATTTVEIFIHSGSVHLLNQMCRNANTGGLGFSLDKYTKLWKLRGEVSKIYYLCDICLCDVCYHLGS